MQALRKKCSKTGTLLVLDEIQTGFGRTGKLWGFEHFEIIPDIILLGKALGAVCRWCIHCRKKINECIH
jgi:4-aminobutyrate aminotransferase-like enzyme